MVSGEAENTIIFRNVELLKPLNIVVNLDVMEKSVTERMENERNERITNKKKEKTELYGNNSFEIEMKKMKQREKSSDNAKLRSKKCTQ